MLVHLVARSLPGYKPFVDPAVSWWLMWRLRLAFPMALAACVMPDHVHLITTTLDPEENTCFNGCQLQRQSQTASTSNARFATSI